MSKTEADILAAFESRCAALATYASSNGISLAKGPNNAITVSAGSKSVVFPIASHPRDWVKLKPEAAFYSRMLDVKSWRNVRIETIEEIPSLAREAGAENDRRKALAQMLGGDEKLDALLAHVEASN